MAEKNSFSSRLLHNAGIFNPVLVQAVGLCPVIAMATTLKGSALLAAVAALAITFSEFVASAFFKKIPRWVRTGIYIIIGGALVTPFMIFIESINPQLFGALGIYLPIMAVNSLLVLRCERFAVKLKPLAALADGFTASLGYAAVLILVGTIREVLGSGSIGGYVFFTGKHLSGLLLPFGGFLMIGFAAAALRSFISVYFPKYLDKKQPKPGKHKQPKKKPQVIVPAPVLPDLTPEENLYSIEEIEAQAPAEQNPEPVLQPQTEHTEYYNAVAQELAENTAEEAIPTEDNEASGEPAMQAEQQNSIEESAQKEKQPEKAEEIVDDDELEKLMNRSMDEVFGKSKEDKK